MKRICIFGDSITWGMGLPQRVGWTDLLRNYLEKQSDYYLEIYSLGIDRNTSKDLLARIEAECEARHPDLLLIDIGTNDSLEYLRDGQLVPETSESDFRNNIENIIKIGRKFTQEIIFVGIAIGNEKLTNPFPRSSTGKRYTKKRITQYNEIIKSSAKISNLAFIDIAPILSEEDFIDGLHPNEAGHKKIFELIFELRQSYFNEKATIVDEKDEVIGAKFRSELTHDDIYRVTGLWLENTKGEVLLAKRAANKSQNPSRWMPVLVSGTISENESYEDNLKKESFEEIGLDVTKYPYSLLAMKRVYTKYNFFATIYKIVADIDIKSLKTDPNETSELRWFDKGELKKQLNSKPNEFVPEAGQIFEGLI